MPSGRFCKTLQLRCLNCGGLCEKNEYARSIGLLKCTEHDPQPLEQQSIKASHQESTSFARVIVCCEAGYDPDNDPYDVTTAVIEVSPKEPPVSWLYQLRIRWNFKIAARRKRKREGKGTKRKQKKRHNRKRKSTLFVAHSVTSKCVSKARKVSSALQVAN